jgi:hypothetical protein
MKNAVLLVFIVGLFSVSFGVGITIFMMRIMKKLYKKLHSNIRLNNLSANIIYSLTAIALYLLFITIGGCLLYEIALFII